MGSWLFLFWGGGGAVTTEHREAAARCYLARFISTEEPGLSRKYWQCLSWVSRELGDKDISRHETNRSKLDLVGGELFGVTKHNTTGSMAAATACILQGDHLPSCVNSAVCSHVNDRRKAKV